jgi:hypothetical protein
MVDALEELIESLLFEGYALYPYTPDSTKNATPTPFGILYPNAYARTLESAFDRLELRAELDAAPDAVLWAEVRFLSRDGERHHVSAQRVAAPGGMLAALLDEPMRKRVRVPREAGTALGVELSLRARTLGSGHHEVTFVVKNRTRMHAGGEGGRVNRADALASALLSTHPILRVSGGRFRSPLERAYDNVNTFPVLATPADDVILGAAIMLGDHPQIAPESHGSLFDGTEIEEALLLHLQALSDGERAAIGGQDPALRAALARAAAATPADLAALHGRVTLRDPQTDSPPTEPPGICDPTLGEESVEVDGRSFVRGGRVRLRPGPDTDLQARMLDGRTATVERIMVAYDGRVHLGVTIDGDPGQSLLRESGRLLYFFPPEVEVIDR